MKENTFMQEDMNFWNEMKPKTIRSQAKQNIVSTCRRKMEANINGFAV